jgi:hypothetical protein
MILQSFEDLDKGVKFHVQSYKRRSAVRVTRVEMQRKEGI